MKIALLSNVNMNMVIRLLQRQADVYETEGYGNELGMLLNPSSSYHAYGPDITFLVMDLGELLEHDPEPETAADRIQNWFATLDGALPDAGIFYVSDAYYFGAEQEALYDSSRKQTLEQLWQNALEEFGAKHSNVRIFPYRRLVEKLGEENAFSLKMWYMGRILLSGEAQKHLAEEILYRTALEQRVPKKVLVLDLDNTLWGGLAGEADHTPIILSEEHGGLAYKNLQRVILQMQKQGVLLAIVSKNNEEDAMAILQEHPHMVLRPQCFAARRINWQPKTDNIREIAGELNLGIDSFVFFDDNPGERELVRQLLPEVTVPDFPKQPEDLAPAMLQIYREYFAKAVVTREDREKTKQYAANAGRNALARQAGSFEDYLKQLAMCLIPVAPEEHVDRLTQLVNKTNQFNLTTRRYTRDELLALLEKPEKRVYLYQVTDRFGDNGIVAAAIIDVGQGEKESLPMIEEFVMSCRVMGRNLEYAIVEDMEEKLRAEGYAGLRGRYLPTAKNKPVERLYDQLGYRRTVQMKDGGQEYEITWQEVPKRVYFVKKECRM